MNKFFVNKEVYKERLDICKSCDDYFKPTGSCKVCGCFMRIKASISVMECPKEYWLKTDYTKTPKEIPEHLQKEVNDIWKDINNGRAKDIKTKTRLVELYNTIYDTTYKTTTNCSSCLSTIFQGIKNLYNDY